MKPRVIALGIIVLAAWARGSVPDAGMYCDAPTDRLLDVGAQLASVVGVSMAGPLGEPPQGVFVKQSLVRQRVTVQTPVRRPLRSVRLDTEAERCVFCDRPDGGVSCAPRRCDERPAGAALVSMQLRLDCQQRRLAMTFDSVFSPARDGGLAAFGRAIDVWLVAEGEHPTVVIEGCFRGWRRAALLTDWRWPDGVVETLCAPLVVDSGGGAMSPWFFVDAGSESER